MLRFFTVVALLATLTQYSQSQTTQFATKLIEYTPAPGQYINASPGLPENAESILNGAAAPGQMVSLGFWGGYIILGFDQAIQNHRDNPYGVDFTVFGNPFLGSSEPGIVQVMKDENGNGKADDTWYELRGSEHFFSTTQRHYSITYTNPHNAENVTWTDSKGQNGEVVYMKAFHAQEHYPMAANFPHINQDNYTLHGTHLKSRSTLGDVWVNYEFDYGYVDNKPIKRNTPLNIPDNPYTLDIIEGCGGDAFDISWAVDKNNNSVNLDEIDFIKIYNGVTQNAGAIGEVSPEVCGVAVVKPDASISGTTKTIICNLPENTGKNPVERRFKWYRNHTFQFEAYIINAGRKDAVQDIIWGSSNPSVASITNEGKLTGHANGATTLHCYSASNPSLTRSIDILIQDGVPTAITSVKQLEIILYPNPAHNGCRIKGADKARISIYDLSGNLLLSRSSYSADELINLSAFKTGIYIVKLEQHNATKNIKLIKR